MNRIDSLLLRVWAKHADILPRFDLFTRQRGGAGAWSCTCGAAFKSIDDWRRRTEPYEEFTLIAGGRVWERRRCPCGSLRSLPVRGGEHASTRNP